MALKRLCHHHQEGTRRDWHVYSVASMRHPMIFSYRIKVGLYAILYVKDGFAALYDTSSAPPSAEIRRRNIPWKTRRIHFPNIFSEGKRPSPGDFPEFSAAPPMGQVGAPFVQFAAGYWLPPRISFGGRIKKAPQFG